MIRNVWTKSSHSSAGGSCVEVRCSEDGRIQVRDSKNLDGPVLAFASAQWSAFIDGTKHDEFDL
jgi:hypothetical protein